MDPKHVYQSSSTCGTLARLIADFDWSETDLGSATTWPSHITSTIRLLLDSPLAIVTLWGQHGTVMYNDACLPLLGTAHPALLGASAAEAASPLAALAQLLLPAGLAGRSGALRDEVWSLNRPATSLDIDFSPIRDSADRPVGLFMVLSDASERVAQERSQAADTRRLQDADRRHRCLSDLSDRLRRCETPSQISGAVSEILGRTLGCSRAGCAVISGQHALIENDWTDGSVPSLSGQYEYAALGASYVAEMTRGKILVVPNVLTHPVASESVALWQDINVQALLNVPLVDKAMPVGILYAHARLSRDWTEAEVTLVEEVADRTWEAMGRARAVEALRLMNASLEDQVRERTLQRDRMWMLSTDIMMVTCHDGRILSVNPAWTRLLGWPQDQVIGSKFYDFIDPSDIERTRAERRKIERGGMIDKFENRYRTKAGGVVWLSWKVVPDGNIVHSVARDVTAEREQADALRAAEEALRHAQKMEAVGQLTGGIAHDFNNLLQGIMGSLEIAERRIEQGRIEGVDKYTAQARLSAERASALTHRLLAFSRRQPLDPKPVRVNQLIMAMEPLLRRTIGERISLEFDLATDLWITRCDPNQLDSAILNLAINARDAMPDGGTLTIRSANIGDSDDKVCVSVTDTGTGMPQEVVERAFDPFYTTKPIGQGTGLGLSMVYGFMRQSGGHATIDSTIGIGTTVSLYLRRYIGTEIADDPDDGRIASAGIRAAQGAVLVLEDEAAVRNVIIDVLQELGFQTLEASDGPAGLEILQSPRQIDLLVTDIGLPGLNGRQVAEAARLLRPSLKILFMTGYAESISMSDGFLSPGMEMITKPFALDGLAERIRQLSCA